MTLLYNIGIHLFSIGIKIASLFNEKARQLHLGRIESLKRIKSQSGDKCIWVHCASLGEFEQGRPVIEAIKKKYPAKRIVLTFFSPSGYEIRKNYELADEVYYLPSDTSKNARLFIEKVNPEMAVFIKYEYWFHYLKQLKKSGIKTYIVSAIFREKQNFFKWYGAWFRKMLGCFDWLFVQDEKSLSLLKSIGIQNASATGDTRFDRVAEIALSAKELPDVEKFVGSRKVIVAGSTWPADEELLFKYIAELGDEYCMIVAPHEVDQGHISKIEQALGEDCALYTKTNPLEWTSKKVLVVDTIGVLSSMYRYGHVAYIGGGFGKGIHNTLEAATYAMPIVFGSNYLKFKEACDLIELKAGFSIVNFTELENVMSQLWADAAFLKQSGKSSGEYVSKMRGATSEFVKFAFV